MISKEKANSILDAIDADNGEEVQRILGESIQNGEMTKDQANSILDAIDADDGDVVMSTLSSLVGTNEQKPLALRPPEDFTPQLSETEQTLQMLFPRLTSKDAGQGFLSDVGKGVGDVASMPFRTLAGGADVLGTLLGGGSAQDAMQGFQNQMTSPRATEGAGMIQGTAEDILKNPMNAFLPLTGSIATKTTAGIANPLARGVLGGGIEGLLSGVGEAGMEQRGIKQEGLNTLLGAGVGSTLGAVPSVAKSFGVESALPKTTADIVQDQAIAQNEQILSSQIPEPILKDKTSLEVFKQLSPDNRIAIQKNPQEYAQYVNQDAMAIESGAEPSAVSVFKNDILPAVNSQLKKEREIGMAMNDIENKYIGDMVIPIAKVQETLNNSLRGVKVAFEEVLDENGDFIKYEPAFFVGNKKVSSSNSSVPANLARYARDLAEMGDEIPAEYIRNQEKVLNGLIASPTYVETVDNTKASMKSLARAFSDAFDTELDNIATPEDALLRRQLNRQFAESRAFTDRIQDNLGKAVEISRDADGFPVVEKTKQGISKMKSLANLDWLNIQGVADFYEELGARTGQDLSGKIKRSFSSMAQAGFPQAKSLLKQGDEQIAFLKDIARGQGDLGMAREAVSVVANKVNPKKEMAQVRMAEKISNPERSRADMKKVDDFFNRYFIGIGALNNSGTNTERKAK